MVHHVQGGCGKDINCTVDQLLTSLPVLLLRCGEGIVHVQAPLWQIDLLQKPVLLRGGQTRGEGPTTDEYDVRQTNDRGCEHVNGIHIGRGQRTWETSRGIRVGVVDCRTYAGDAIFPGSCEITLYATLTFAYKVTRHQ